MSVARKGEMDGKRLYDGYDLLCAFPAITSIKLERVVQISLRRRPFGGRPYVARCGQRARRHARMANPSSGTIQWRGSVPSHAFEDAPLSKGGSRALMYSSRSSISSGSAECSRPLSQAPSAGPDSALASSLLRGPRTCRF
jgi:hypothetical protein